MSVDSNDVFQRGGPELVAFLEYCVRSINLDALLLFLVHEYRSMPSDTKALAIHDLLHAPQVRLHRDWSSDPLLAASMQPMLQRRDKERAPQLLEPLPPRVLPPKYLFDRVVRAVLQRPDNGLELASRCFDPALSPVQNLPGGAMNEAQRVFVDKVWQPVLRPALAAAGFRRIANVA